MNSRNLLDRLTSTRVASWSDRGRHRRALAHHGLVAQKVYLLGYAAACPATVQRVGQYVHRRSAWCLRGVFRALPWGEDAFGYTPIGPMCAVYLLLEPSHTQQVVILESSPGSPVLLHVPANGFPFHFLFGKTLVSEAASSALNHPPLGEESV